MKYLKTVLIFFLSSQFFLSWALAQEKPVKEIEVIGEFFGQPVPAQNYFFVKSVISAFRDNLGLTLKSEEELEEYTWDYLLLSYEAFRNNISATPEEVTAEIKNILKKDNVHFDLNKDKAAFAEWVKQKTNQNLTVFENQVKFIVEIDKLRRKVMDNFSVKVSDEEAFWQFQDEYSYLTLEVAGFPAKEDAQKFYEKVKESPKVWEEQKGQQPDSFKRYELMSLNSLMRELGVDREVLHKILDLKNEDIYTPLQITRGYGIFKILNKKLASQAEYDKLKYSYVEQLKENKRNQGFEEWLGMVKQKAKIKIYRKGG